MFSSFNLLLIKHSRYLCSGSKRKKSLTKKAAGAKRHVIPSTWQSTAGLLVKRAEVLVKRGKWQGHGLANNFGLAEFEFLNEFDTENPILIKGFPPCPSIEPIAASIGIRDFHVKNGGTYLCFFPISSQIQYRLGANDPLNTQVPLFDPLTNTLCNVRYRVTHCSGSVVDHTDTDWTTITSDEYWVWNFTLASLA